MRKLFLFSLCSAVAFTASCSSSSESSSPLGDGGAAGTGGLSGAAGQAGSTGAIGGGGGASSGTGGISGAGTGGSGASAGQGGAGAGGAGSGGTGGSSGSAGSGGRQYSTDPATFFGEPRCEGLAVCESFESTADGGLPQGFNLTGYGTRTVGVVGDLGARGSRSLRIQVPAAQGSVTAWLTKASLGALGGAHFGRVFVRVEEPAPTEFVHFDLFAGIGPFEGHTNEVRWAVTGTGAGTTQDNWSFIYNVQPSGNGSGAEFASEGDRSAHPSVGSFMCLEWSFDAAAPDAQFFLDGNAIEYLHIDTERSEIPVFESLAVGFAKYQNTGAFTVYVDEVAFDPERIGCNN